MTNETKLLIIDDHPIIIEGYKKTLMDKEAVKIPLVIDAAISCDEAMNKIEESLKRSVYDIIFLDIGLPPSVDNEFLSGEDLGMKIREISPLSKLVVITMHKENSRLTRILKNLDPDSFLIKSDITSSELQKAFTFVMDENHYLSHTVSEVLRKQFINDFNLDNIDREILFHLSKGVKTKNLIDVIPLSLASIEKRKRRIKEAFDLEDGRDLILVNKAKQLGFI